MIADCPAVVLFFLYMINCNSAGLVYPRLLESRDGSEDLVLNIRENVTLYLEKSTVLAENVHLDSSTTAGTHRTILNGQEIEANLYHDEHHQSSLILTRSPHGVEVRGILNHEFTITPSVVSERSNDGTILHEISLTEKLSHVASGADGEMKNDANLQRHTDSGRKSTKERRHSPRRFVAELWLVVSSEYWAAFRTQDALLAYLAATVNSVALRFINMTNPKIRFQLNGITIDHNDTLTKDTVCSIHQLGIWRRPNKITCGVDVEDTLNRTAFLVFKSNINADLVYLLTSKNLVRNIKLNDTTILEDVLGMAYISGVCTSLKTGVGEDKPGTYSGVTTMAHELAHILGSWHDGEPARGEMTGHPGGAKCPAKDGYLMGDWTHTRNEYRLSECTKEQIQYNFRRLPLECIKLRNQASVTNNYYPGQVLDLLTYCQVLHPDIPDISANDDERGNGYKKCRIQCCWNEDYEDDYTVRLCESHRMLEAMPCGQNKTCRRGVCGVHNWTDIYNTRRTF